MLRLVVYWCSVMTEHRARISKKIKHGTHFGRVLVLKRDVAKVQDTRQELEHVFNLLGREPDDVERLRELSKHLGEVLSLDISARFLVRAREAVVRDVTQLEAWVLSVPEIHIVVCTCM